LELITAVKCFVVQAPEWSTYKTNMAIQIFSNFSLFNEISIIWTINALAYNDTISITNENSL